MSKDERYVWVDSLKGIAILGVIMIHSGAMSVGGIIGKIGQYGSSFVQAFFVISALLIWKSLDKREEKFTILSGVKWSIKKLIKIIPMYYTSIILCLIFTEGNKYWAGDESPFSVMNIFTHALFLHGLFPKFCDSIIGVEWYLGVLAIMYFVAPFLHKIVNSFIKALVFFIASEIICYTVCQYAIDYYNVNEYSYIYEQYYNGFSFVSQLPTLALGIVLYYLLQTDIVKCERKGIRIGLSIISLIVAMVVLKCPFLTFDITTQLALGFAIYILGQSIYAIPLMNNMFFSFIGRNSLGIYLFHCLIIFFYEKVILSLTGNIYIDWEIKYVVVIGCSLAICHVFNRVQRCFLNYRNKEH